MKRDTVRDFIHRKWCLAARLKCTDFSLFPTHLLPYQQVCVRVGHGLDIIYLNLFIDNSKICFDLFFFEKCVLTSEQNVKYKIVIWKLNKRETYIAAC